MRTGRPSEPAGRHLFALSTQVAAVIAIGITAGFLFVIGLQIVQSQSFHYDAELHHKIDKTALLAEQLYPAIRYGDPGPIRRVYESLAAHEHLTVAGATVTDGDGRTLTSYQQSLTDPVDFPAVLRSERGWDRSHGVATTTRGNRFIVVAPVISRDGADAAGSFVVAWNLADLNAASEATALGQGASAILAVVLFAAATLLFVRQRLAKPLDAITKAITRIASGEREVDIPWTERWDEIGDMARALVTFRSSIAQVDRLTSEQQKLALRLADALDKEREYSALHREFVSMVSHEFRTPVAIIDGAAQRIQRRAGRDTPEELLRRAAKIRAAATRMIGLIESTLSVSRLEAGTIELETTACDLGSLLTDICQRQQELSNEHVISLTVENLPATLPLDGKRVDQIFTNLLSNAVKYSPNAPSIDVEARADNDRVVVSVRDCGLGIPQGELPKLFGKYFRASTSKGISGTGIGLHLVRHLVELHGGTISVESEEGAGTLFTVSFPCADAGRGDRVSGAEAISASRLCA